MRKVTVTVSFCEKSFESKFEIEDHIKEYQISDEAYRLALLFAKTQIIAKFGHMVPFYKFAPMMETLDYQYTIKEA